jgi:tetratricopeptide (TPR) repeat protein
MLPADGMVRALLGQYYLERNQPQLAEGPLKEAVATEPGDVPLRELLALTHLRLGNQAAGDGRFPEALRHYDAAVAEKPDLAEAHANKVQVCIHQRDFAGAEAAMMRLVALRPENAAVHASLGDIQLSAGKVTVARASWRRAIGLLGDPSNPLHAALEARLEDNPER